ncbi:MAG: transglutaminase domain-containing protein [Clostridia bacterium]|nr:transglutaminase domain-containing protein [Clostridia bacterium]
MFYDLYTSLLKMHDTFRPADTDVHLSIDYTAPTLTELREKYALAAIAGDGDPFDRAVRLMDWLTTHVRHDGDCNPEGSRCALTALEYAFDKADRGVNCAWLATTLSECLLSLGIAARTMYIMPFAPYDCDNHVVTHAWTGTQWVMLDPTTNCYVRDKEGHLLDVFGLRALLADQQEVVFNDALRYNGNPYNAQEHRDYLAKDLFWFQTAEASGSSDSRQLTIAPEGYDPHKRDVLNIQYRMRVQGDAPWLHSWLEITKASVPVFCSVEDMKKAP